MTSSAQNRTSNHFIENVRQALLRGGRMTKHKGQAASYAPMLGVVAVALMSSASVMLMGASAVAGTCTETGGAGSGIWTCSGAANLAADTTQSPTSASTGAVSVTTSAGFGITTSLGNALTLSNAASNTSVAFTDANSAAITGATDGIKVRNRGTGTTSITTNGTVTGGTGRGIYVYNSNALSTDLTISAATVTGGTTGIAATNAGTGATSVTATGTVSQSINNNGSSSGIVVLNRTNATSLTVSAAAVTAGTGTYTYGIKVQNLGTGATSVTVTGAVTSNGRDGILALGLGTSLMVTTVAVTGGRNGINAFNNSTSGGATTITATGTVTGTNYNGINAINNSTTSTDITISAVAVTGAKNGIYAQNKGTGTNTITVTGAVTGGTGYGIYTVGANTTITLNAGAVVSATSGNAIFNDLGNSTTTVNTGATVTGKIVLGAGSDSLTFAGGNFGAVTLFDGGAGVGTDALSFVGSGVRTLVGANVTNWENVAIGTGSTIIFSDNALTAGALTVASGGTLFASGGNFALTGNLTNNGSVTMQNGTVGDAATVSGNFVGAGTLVMDINTTNDTADTLAIAGNSSGTTQISVNNLTPGVATGNSITLVTVAGTSAAGDFTLAGGPLTYGAYDYSLSYQAGSFVLGGSLGQTLNSTGATYTSAPVILNEFNNLQSMEQRIDGRAQRVGQAAWISFHGGNSKTALTNGSKTDSNLYGFQVGTDLEFEPGNNGHWVLGLTGQYGNLSSTTTNLLLETSTIDTTGYGLGLSATWYGNEGTYMDAQGQVNWLSSDLSSSSSGLLVKGHNSTTYAMSVEAGHRFILSSTTALVPQVQVTWGSVDGGSFTDSVGNNVNLSSNNSTVGRFGMAYEFNRKGAREKFYVIGSLLRDFSSNSSVTVAGVTMNTDLANPTSAEVGFGGTKNFGGVELYGEAGLRAALGSSNFIDDRSFGGTLGLRMKF